MMFASEFVFPQSKSNRYGNKQVRHVDVDRLEDAIKDADRSHKVDVTKMAERQLGYSVMNTIQDYLMDYMYNTNGNPYTCFEKFSKGSNSLDDRMLL
jgi:hypothetical protein